MEKGWVRMGKDEQKERVAGMYGVGIKRWRERAGE